MDINAESLAAKAQQFTRDKQFKEALACYRQLWIEDDSTRWSEAMAECYLARAREFGRRAMYRQAVEQWRQYQQLVESPVEVLHQLVLWQLGAGDIKAAELQLSRLTVEQLDNHTGFSKILALLVMSQYTELRWTLPKESQFVNDLKLVESALHCLPDVEACLDNLQQLPEHSVFAEIAGFVRTLLKPDKPLSGIGAQLIAVLQLQGAQFINAVVKLNAEQRQLIYRLRKLKPGQQQFIEQYADYSAPVDAVQQFDLVMQYKQLTDSETAFAFCQAAMPNDFLRWLKFKKQFPQCSDFELCRLKALACERSGDYRAAEQHWLDAIDCISAKAEHDLEVALILRHIADFYPPEEQLSWLEESLQYDPDDIDTQEKVAKLERQMTVFSVAQENDDVDQIVELFAELPKPQLEALWQTADQLMMTLTPEQLAKEFQAEAGQANLEQVMARTPAMMDGLMLLKAARQLDLPTPVTVKQLLQTVMIHE